MTLDELARLLQDLHAVLTRIAERLDDEADRRDTAEPPPTDQSWLRMEPS